MSVPTHSVVHATNYVSSTGEDATVLSEATKHVIEESLNRDAKKITTNVSSESI